MPRIRTLKPEFWADEKLGPMEPIDRLVFVGLISMADDAGRLVDSVKQIDAMLFPYTDDSSRGSLERLAKLSRILRYTSESGQQIVWICHWSEHQKIDHPNLKAALPPPSTKGPFATDSRESREPLAPLPVPVPTTVDHGPTTESLVGQMPDGGMALTLRHEGNGNGKHLPARRFEEVKNRIGEVMAEVVESGRRSFKREELAEIQAQVVFAYWAAKHSHESALLDPKRLARLKSRLKENNGNVHELLFVVDGAKRDRHLMGQNDAARKYDGIETLFRDRGQVERLALQGGYKSGAEHPMAKKYAAIVEEP